MADILLMRIKKQNKYVLKNLVILFLLSRIRIRIEQILRIRIRIRSIRIRIPDVNTFYPWTCPFIFIVIKLLTLCTVCQQPHCQYLKTLTSIFLSSNDPDSIICNGKIPLDITTLPMYLAIQVFSLGMPTAPRPIPEASDV